MNLTTIFHPQIDGQVVKTIQTLEDMRRSYVIDFECIWVDHLLHIEFAYNDSYHSSIRIDPFKVLYVSRWRSPIRWFENGETRLFGPILVHQDMKMVKVIRDSLKTAQSG